MKSSKLKYSLFLFLFLTSSRLNAAPGQLSISLGAIGSLACSSIPLSADQGLGLTGAVEYRFSKFFAGGLNLGMVEFIAAPKTGGLPPTVYQRQDMKTIWLDLSGRFFPLPSSPLGEAYVQLGFGVSPHFHLNLSGHLDTFTDYWPNYTYEIYPGPEFYPDDPGTLNWDAQASIGYQFSLGENLALDLGLQYDHFWPPADRPLETLGLRTQMVFFFGKSVAAVPK